MPYGYESWRYTRVTCAQMDASVGTPLLTTGEAPRVIFQLCAYQGTNTNATEFGMFLIPATQGPGIDGNGQVAIAGDVSFAYGKVDASLSSTTEQVPLQFGPWGTKGTTNGAWMAIIPPNSMLVAGALSAANGTIECTCISAELSPGMY
jgi:hypothetical protein